jgi:septal ring factor EnvC (AmiA/AmiB activator)
MRRQLSAAVLLAFGFFICMKYRNFKAELELFKSVVQETEDRLYQAESALQKLKKGQMRVRKRIKKVEEQLKSAQEAIKETDEFIMYYIKSRAPPGYFWLVLRFFITNIKKYFRSQRLLYVSQAPK